jgi:hypothetical protein
MDLTKNLLFEKLINYGLFPDETEKMLTATNFGKWITDNPNLIKIKKNENYSFIKYKLTRNNNVPRYMGIPHPLAYLALSKVIQTHWVKIQNRFEKVKNYKEISLLSPHESKEIRAIILIKDYSPNRKDERIIMEKQNGKKYVAYSDIANFFPSIYTHGLCWALVNKDTAKKNMHDKKKWYNQLDLAVRNMQRCETMGILIGPDTSFIISEIILSQVDKKLEKYTYVRHIDDYKCYCASKEEAENFLRDLGSALEDFHLVINTKKTTIAELPVPLDEAWVRFLRNFMDLKTINNFNKNKITDYFDFALDYYKKNPNTTSVKYATKVLLNKTYADYPSYEYFLEYFRDLCFLSPYLIDVFDDVINIGITNFSYASTSIKDAVKVTIEKILKENLQYQRSDIISICIFLAIKYDITLNSFSSMIQKLLKTGDCVPILMAYLYAKIHSEDLTSFINLEKKIESNEWWLFIYELHRIEKKSLTDPRMEIMRKANVTFLSGVINNKINSIAQITP